MNLTWLMSLFAIVAFVGCDSRGKPQPDVAPSAAGEHADHGHPSEGPHGGHLIELGNEEYHAELTHDEKSHTVSVYILDAAAKATVPIDAADVQVNLVLGGKPSQFTLPAKPMENDPSGKSSRFELADEKLMEALEAETTKGRLNVSIGGKDYSGEIEHHEHAGHAH